MSEGTVYGIIGNQILKRARVFTSRAQVISLMRKATMGMDELKDFSETPWWRGLELSQKRDQERALT